MTLAQHKPPPGVIKFKPRAKIRTYGAENIFELQNSHIRDLTVDCLVELGSKVRLKKLRKLSLSLGRVPWRLRSWLNKLGLTEADIKVRAVLWTSSEQQQLNKALWQRMLAMMRFWMGRRDPYRARLQWYLQVIFRDNWIAVCTVGYCSWWSRWTAYSSGVSFSSFNL